jgi:hypothetical protein
MHDLLSNEYVHLDVWREVLKKTSLFDLISLVILTDSKIFFVVHLIKKLLKLFLCA